MSKPELKWLFVAFFSDGSKIYQTAEDESEDGSGSAFSDVMAREDELIAFGIHNDDRSILVDLTSGLFQIDGLWVGLHNQNFDPTKEKLKVIYFRETRVERDIQDGEVVADRHFVNRYFVGWQVEGKEIKHMVHI